MDDVNRKIISILQRDGRATFKELGRVVGYTAMGVKKRFKRLLERGVVKVSAMLNVEALKLHAAIVMLEMESAEAMHKLLKRFEECPRVVHIFSTLGGYNVIALMVAETQGTLEGISMEKCSLRSSEGIRRSEFYPIGNIYYSPFLPVRAYLTRKGRTISPCNVDCRPCWRYQTNKCVGCPATRHYHGPL